MCHNICLDDKGIATFIVRLLTVTKLGLFYFFSITPLTFFPPVNRSEETNLLSENGKEPITVFGVFHFSGKSATTSDFVVVVVNFFVCCCFAFLLALLSLKYFTECKRRKGSPHLTLRPRVVLTSLRAHHLLW